VRDCPDTIDLCNTCIAEQCRAVCDEQYGKVGIQAYIDSGCDEGNGLHAECTATCPAAPENCTEFQAMSTGSGCAAGCDSLTLRRYACSMPDAPCAGYNAVCRPSPPSPPPGDDYYETWPDLVQCSDEETAVYSRDPCDWAPCNENEHFECSSGNKCYAGNADERCAGKPNGHTDGLPGHTWCWDGYLDFECGPRDREQYQGGNKVDDDKCYQCVRDCPDTIDLCNTCIAEQCRAACEEQHGTEAIQAYIVGGCNDVSVYETNEDPHGSGCGGQCRHEVYGEICSLGTWGGGQSFMQVCENGVNYAKHYGNADCQGAIVNEWAEDSACQNEYHERTEDGTALYESKWCNGSTPMWSLCTVQGESTGIAEGRCGQCIATMEACISDQSACIADQCRAACNEQPILSYYIAADFSSSDCSGTPIRQWNVPFIPTSAAAADYSTCHSPLSTWSIHGEWCDFSDSQPKLRGTFFADSSDCSTYGVGYGTDGNGSIADRMTCNVYSDGTSSRYLCVTGTPHMGIF